MTQGHGPLLGAGPFPVLDRGYAGVMRRPAPPALSLLVAAWLALAACSVQDGPTGTAAPTTTRVTTTTEVTTTTQGPTSSAVVEIGPARYELDAVCVAGGAGEVEVAVEGLDINGLRVIGLIRAFLGEPYVGLQVGEGDEAVLFEPRLEGVLSFDVAESMVTFDEVEFVTELDLSTGEFVPAGVGSVTVECLEYVRVLPAVPFD